MFTKAANIFACSVLIPNATTGIGTGAGEGGAPGDALLSMALRLPLSEPPRDQLFAVLNVLVGIIFTVASTAGNNGRTEAPATAVWGNPYDGDRICHHGGALMDDDTLDPVEGAEIAALQQAHQDLDDTVRAMASLPIPDQLQVARLKKEGRALRERIAELESRLKPDLIA